MRPLESALIVSNGLALAALLAPLPASLVWLRTLAPAVLLVALAQMVIEGVRWPMAPAYLLAILVLLLWWWQQRSTPMPAGPPTRWLAVAGVSFALSIALPWLFPVFRFAVPSGSYAIGTVSYHWVDVARPERFMSAPDDRRELMVQVWYPAQTDRTAPRTPYLPDARAVLASVGRALHVPAGLLSNLGDVRTHAVERAPVAEDEASYPVLLYLEGLYGTRQMSQFQIEELVSHGYIVVGIDHPYAAASVRFPDGRVVDALPVAVIDPLIDQSFDPVTPPPTLNGQPLPEGIIPYLADDVAFVIDQLGALNDDDAAELLTGHLDLQHLGTFGVSLGGIVASELCARDGRLRACLMMDAPMTVTAVRDGLPQPAMWLTRDAATMRREGWPEFEIERHLNTMRALYAQPSATRYFVTIPGMFHVNFTDAPYWSPLIRMIGLAGPIDAQRGHRIVNAYTLAFFDTHLRGWDVPLLSRQPSPYPEVQIERTGQ